MLLTINFTDVYIERPNSTQSSSFGCIYGLYSDYYVVYYRHHEGVALALRQPDLKACCQSNKERDDLMSKNEQVERVRCFYPMEFMS